MNKLQKIRATLYSYYYRFRYGIKIRKNTDDLAFFNQIFVYQDYDCETELNPKFILDCGGNVGYAAIYFTLKYPEAKIISIEPNKENFDVLVENCKKYKNIFPINKALWGSETKLNFLNPETPYNGGYRYGESKNDNDLVETVTMDFLTKDQDKIDILKMDIEGGEISLFQNEYISWLKKVQFLFIEPHDIHTIGCSEIIFQSITNHNTLNPKRPLRFKRICGENFVFEKEKNNKDDFSEDFS